MTNDQYAMLRNILWVVVLLLVASVGSNIYAGLKLEVNSRVFENIYVLLESGMGEQFGAAMAQAKDIEKELSQVRSHARAVSENMRTLDEQFRKAAKDAEDSLAERLNKELPALMDRYIEARTTRLRDPAGQEEMRQIIRETLTQVVREEMGRATKR